MLGQPTIQPSRRIRSASWESAARKPRPTMRNTVSRGCLRRLPRASRSGSATRFITEIRPSASVAMTPSPMLGVASPCTHGWWRAVRSQAAPTMAARRPSCAAGCHRVVIHSGPRGDDPASVFTLISTGPVPGCCRASRMLSHMRPRSSVLILRAKCRHPPGAHSALTGVTASQSSDADGDEFVAPAAASKR